jgi:hypothetical protein
MDNDKSILEKITDTVKGIANTAQCRQLRAEDRGAAGQDGG